MSKLDINCIASHQLPLKLQAQQGVMVRAHIQRLGLQQTQENFAGSDAHTSLACEIMGLG